MVSYSLLRSDLSFVLLSGAFSLTAGRGQSQDYPACTEVPWRDHFLFEYYPIQNFETPQQIAAGKRVNDSPVRFSINFVSIVLDFPLRFH